MDEKRPVGRPPLYKDQYVAKHIHVRVDHDEKLKEYPNQRQVMEEALDLFFDMDGHSNKWLLKRREEIKRELSSIDTTINLREQKEKELKEKQEKFIDQFDAFCSFIDSSPTGSACNTKRINATFGLNLTGYKEFAEIEKSYNDGKFNRDDFIRLKDVK